jgi:hypothetical protein
VPAQAGARSQATHRQKKPKLKTKNEEKDFKFLV